MPRGQRKKGAFAFAIWFQDGARISWESLATRPQTDAEIASAIRRYLVPIAERLEQKVAKAVALQSSPSQSEELSAALAKEQK